MSRIGLYVRALMHRLVVVAAFSWCVVLAEARDQDQDPQELSDRRTITADDLASVRDIEGLSVSPDGRWAAFQLREAVLSENRYETSWHVVSTDGASAARRLADAGDPIQPMREGRTNGFILVPAPLWLPDSRWIIYLRQDRGRTQIWRTSLDGRKTEQLTRNESDVRAFALFARTYILSGDGRRLLFEVEPSRAQIESALDREGMSGYIFDERFLPAYSQRPLLPAAGSEMSDSMHRRDINPQVWVYDLDEGVERPAEPAEESEFVSTTRAQGPSGREGYRTENGPPEVSRSGLMAWLEARDPGQQGGEAPLTVVTQRPSGHTVVCPHAACTSQFHAGIWWRNDQELVFARREGPAAAETALYSWTLDSGIVRLILRTRDKFAGNPLLEWDCSIGRDRLVCFIERPSEPRQLAMIDLDTGRERVLHNPNPHFANLDLGHGPSLVEIALPSGGATYGYLVLPPNVQTGERLPLVVATYRCDGFLRGGTGDEYPIFPWAARGLAVFCLDLPDYDIERAAVMNPSDYARWLRGPGEPRMHLILKGLRAAIDRLRDTGLIDERRIALTGLSAGAETVSYALVSTSHVSAAIASGVGYEPNDYYLFGPRSRPVFASWGLGAPDRDRERWQVVSLALNATKVRAPLLLNVSERELLYALHPFMALQDAGRAVEMYVFPDEYHVKWQPAHRFAIYNRNIDWMNFWLRGVEDPAPAKAEQYQRWRAMRVKQCELFKGDDAPWYCRQ